MSSALTDLVLSIIIVASFPIALTSYDLAQEFYLTKELKAIIMEYYESKN